MAPKKIRTDKGKKRLRGEDGQGSNANLEPNWEIEQTNRYLFRDTVGYENYMYSFANRTLSNCYYFDKTSVTFTPPEDDKLWNFIAYWNWHPFLSCCEPYSPLLTRVFYSNLKYIEQPFIFSTYLCGREINLSFENLANWLEVPNEGEETYLMRTWPALAVGSSTDYKIWFNFHSNQSTYVSSLPSLHRLLFTFINNCLIPKATIKTNLEWGPMYYLRHLLEKDRTFHITFIVLSHMRSALKSTVATLPYANIIHKILRANEIMIPEDQEIQHPTHLVDFLLKIGWVKVPSPSSLTNFGPDNRDVNAWINAPDALPNQYWNPHEPQQQEPPVIPQQVEMPGIDQFVMPPTPQAQMEYLCRSMHAQRLENQENFREIRKDVRQVRLRTNRNFKELRLLRESQASLTARFIAQFGVETGSSSQPIFPPDFDEDADITEDEDDEDILDNQEFVNPDDDGANV